MHQAAEAFSLRPPAQVGGGIDSALGGLAKQVGRTERQDAVQQAAQRDRVDRQRRLPARPLGIGQQRLAHDGEARTAVGAVFICDAFYPKRTWNSWRAPSRRDQVALHVHGGVRLSQIAFAASEVATLCSPGLACPPSALMRQKSMPEKEPATQVVKNIRRATPRHFSAEDKIRIVLEGLRGDDSIAELCRREGIAQNLYYRWSKRLPGGWQEAPGWRYGSGRHLGRGQRSATRGHGAQGGGCPSDPGKPCSKKKPDGDGEDSETLGPWTRALLRAGGLRHGNRNSL